MKRQGISPLAVDVTFADLVAVDPKIAKIIKRSGKGCPNCGRVLRGHPKCPGCGVLIHDPEQKRGFCPCGAKIQ